MQQLGLPIPPGFIISTEACRDFYSKWDAKAHSQLMDEIERALKNLEIQTSRSFGVLTSGDTDRLPLLLSVRPSSSVSTMGLKSTVVNVGLNSFIVHRLIANGVDEKWVLTSYARFLISFGTATPSWKKATNVDSILKKYSSHKISQIWELDNVDLRNLITGLRAAIPVPEEPMEQLKLLVVESLESYTHPAAIDYRKTHNISDSTYMAIVLQAMVYGDFNELSGAGVMYTRNPNTGVKELFGEYVVQGLVEDAIQNLRPTMKFEKLFQLSPASYDKLINVEGMLERHHRDMLVSTLCRCWPKLK